MNTGRIHSIETLGCLDGPGLRTVVFFQGCPLRCVYCHNPDTWNLQEGQAMAVEEIVQKACRLRPYMGENGGVTLSGGEPLMQGKFTIELLNQLKKEGFHTALDTSGIGNPADYPAILQYTDLVICDLKFATEALYRAHTGGSLKAVRQFLCATEQAHIPLWIRHVVVPELTDQDDPEIRAIAGRYQNLQKLEWLPFRKLCLSKYEQLGIPFPLADTPDATKLPEL